MTVHPGKRRSISVTISRQLRNQIIRQAKRICPNECYGIMLGTASPRGVEIEWIYWPDVCGDYSEDATVRLQPEWWQHADELARDKGLRIIGDVHSHCYDLPTDDHAPSQQDWDRFNRDYIQGICLVTQDGDKQRASLKFWAMPPAVTTKVSDG